MKSRRKVLVSYNTPSYHFGDSFQGTKSSVQWSSILAFLSMYSPAPPSLLYKWPRFPLQGLAVWTCELCVKHVAPSSQNPECVLGLCSCRLESQ